MEEKTKSKMTDEQYKEWLNTEEGGEWLASQIKKKLHEYDQLIKLSRARKPKYLKS